MCRYWAPGPCPHLHRSRIRRDSAAPTTNTIVFISLGRLGLVSGALLSGLQNRYSNSQSTRTTNTIEIELLVLYCQHKCFIIFQNVLTFYKTTIKGCQHVRVHFKVIVATRCTNRYKSPNSRVSVLRLLILSPDNQSGSRKVLG